MAQWQAVTTVQPIPARAAASDRIDSCSRATNGSPPVKLIREMPMAATAGISAAKRRATVTGSDALSASRGETVATMQCAQRSGQASVRLNDRCAIVAA